METSNAYLIVKALRTLESEDNEVRAFRPEYSGRSMYGDKCIAADLPSGVSAAKVVLLIVKEVLSDLRDECDDEFDMSERLDDLCEDLANVREDSMGLGTIVYWPRIQFPADESDE